MDKQTPLWDMQDLLVLLRMHKDNAGELFSFIHDTPRKTMTDAFLYAGQNADGLVAIINQAKKEGDGKLMSRLADPKARELMHWLVDNSAKAELSIKYLKNPQHTQSIIAALSLIAENNKDLTKMAEFAGKHIDEIGNHDFASLAKSHPIEFAKMAQFYHTHERELKAIGAGNVAGNEAKNSAWLGETAGFLLTDPAGMKLFAEGMSGLKDGLGPSIEAKQRSVNDMYRDLQGNYEKQAGKEENLAKGKLEKLRRLKSENPEVFAIALGLEKEALEMISKQGGNVLVSDANKWDAQRSADQKRYPNLPDMVTMRELGMLPNLQGAVGEFVKQNLPDARKTTGNNTPAHRP